MSVLTINTKRLVAPTVNDYYPKDLEDIRTIAEKYPNLDTKRIKQWVNAFAEALEQPDLWNQIELLLKN